MQKVLAVQVNLLLMALTFYTRISVFQPNNYDEKLLPKANRYFPVIGLVVGGLGAAVGQLSLLVFSPSVSAWLMLFSAIALTGAFHEDGLSDTVDSLGGWGVETRLRIMKDSTIGNYGALVLIFSIGLKAFFWIDLPASVWFLSAILVHVLSRIIPLYMILFLNYVREDESQKVKPIAKAIQGKDLLIASILTFVICAPVSFILSPWLPVMLFVSLAATIMMTKAWLKKILGGYTGDLLGASQQIGELFVLATLVGFLA